MQAATSMTTTTKTLSLDDDDDLDRNVPQPVWFRRNSSRVKSNNSRQDDGWWPALLHRLEPRAIAQQQEIMRNKTCQALWTRRERHVLTFHLIRKTPSCEFVQVEWPIEAQEEEESNKNSITKTQTLWLPVVNASIQIQRDFDHVFATVYQDPVDDLHGPLFQGQAARAAAYQASLDRIVECLQTNLLLQSQEQDSQPKGGQDASPPFETTKHKDMNDMNKNHSHKGVAIQPPETSVPPNVDPKQPAEQKGATIMMNLERNDKGIPPESHKAANIDHHANTETTSPPQEPVAVQWEHSSSHANSTSNIIHTNAVVRSCIPSTTTTVMTGSRSVASTSPAEDEANDIPDLLPHLSFDPHEPWHALWSKLCFSGWGRRCSNMHEAAAFGQPCMIYTKPGRTSTGPQAVRGRDYFIAEQEVQAYWKINYGWQGVGAIVVQPVVDDRQGTVEEEETWETPPHQRTKPQDPALPLDQDGLQPFSSDEEEEAEDEENGLVSQPSTQTDTTTSTKKKRRTGASQHKTKGSTNNKRKVSLESMVDVSSLSEHQNRSIKKQKTQTKENSANKAVVVNHEKKRLGSTKTNSKGISSHRSSSNKAKDKLSLYLQFKTKHVPSFSRIWPILQKLQYYHDDEGKICFPKDSFPNDTHQQQLYRFQSMQGLRKFFAREGIPRFNQLSQELTKAEYELFEYWVRFANVPVHSHNSVKLLKDVKPPRNTAEITKLFNDNGFQTLDGYLYVPGSDRAARGTQRGGRRQPGVHKFHQEQQLSELRAFVRGAPELHHCLGPDHPDPLTSPPLKTKKAPFESQLSLRVYGAIVSLPLNELKMLPERSDYMMYLENMVEENNGEEVGVQDTVEEDKSTTSAESTPAKDESHSQKDEERSVEETDASTADSTAATEEERSEPDVSSTSSVSTFDSDNSSPPGKRVIPPWYLRKSYPNFTKQVWPILRDVFGFCHRGGMYYHSDYGTKGAFVHPSDLAKYICKHGFPRLGDIVQNNSEDKIKDVLRWVQFANVPVQERDSIQKLSQTKILKKTQIQLLLNKLRFQTLDNKYFPPGSDQVFAKAQKEEHTNDAMDSQSGRRKRQKRGTSSLGDRIPGYHYFDGLEGIRAYCRANDNLHMCNDDYDWKHYITEDEYLAFRLWAATSETPLPTFVSHREEDVDAREPLPVQDREVHKKSRQAPLGGVLVSATQDQSPPQEGGDCMDGTLLTQRETEEDDNDEGSLEECWRDGDHRHTAVESAHKPTAWRKSTSVSPLALMLNTGNDSAPECMDAEETTEQNDSVPECTETEETTEQGRNDLLTQG